MVLHPLPPSMPPALRSMRSITPPAPPSECRGIYHVGFFGLALTFAAKSMEHTANQLQQWAKEPDLGVKSFANSASTHHSNTDVLCDEGREYQPMNDEHRHRAGVVFWRARQMVGGSTNKLTAAGFDRADKKASTFNAAEFSLVGNNSTGANMFGRKKN